MHVCLSHGIQQRLNQIIQWHQYLLKMLIGWPLDSQMLKLTPLFCSDMVPPHQTAEKWHPRSAWNVTFCLPSTMWLQNRSPWALQKAALCFISHDGKSAPTRVPGCHSDHPQHCWNCTEHIQSERESKSEAIKGCKYKSRATPHDLLLWCTDNYGKEFLFFIFTKKSEGFFSPHVRVKTSVHFELLWSTFLTVTTKDDWGLFSKSP